MGIGHFLLQAGITGEPPDELNIHGETSQAYNDGSEIENEVEPARDIRPFFARVITIPTVADDDWMIRVTRAPVSGKIFGTVTSLQLSRAIREQKGYEIDRKRIHIADEVKELGAYKASIDFGNGNSTEVEFEVVSE